MSLIHPDNNSYPAPASWVKILIHIITRSRNLLFIATGISLATFPVLLCLSDSIAVGQSSPQQFAQIPLAGRTMSQVNVTFVNPNLGNDTIGNGSERAPFKTITQALRVAQPNTVILLASGTYSASSGESFPLTLKSSVSIQGDPRMRSHNILIQGGGTFMSPMFARQDATIIGANQAGLAGVTVTNPNPSGYGLWIESSSPVVMDNTFTGNTQGGISVIGNSAPIIRTNRFYQNGANGITISGVSRPEVRENVFERTGLGITIAQDAAPVLIGNRITQNKAGLVLRANSRPVLQNNVIEGNTEDKVVAIAQQDDAGTRRHEDTETPSAQRQIVNALRQARVRAIPQPNRRASRTSSNRLRTMRSAGSRLVGRQPLPIISGNSVTNRSSSAAPTPPSRVVPVKPPSVSPAIPAKPLTPASVPSASRRIAAERIRSSILPVRRPKPVELSPAAERDTSATTEMAPIVIPVPLPESTTSQPQTLGFLQITSITPNQSEENVSTRNTRSAPVMSSDRTIELTAPAMPPQQTVRKNEPTLPALQSPPIVESELLPVPGPDIPIGDTGNLSRVPAAQASLNSSFGSQRVPLTRAVKLRYRVVVEADSQRERVLLRSLVPHAFRSISKGRVVMQVGAFSDRDRAEQMLQLLNSNGLKAELEPIDD